MEILARRVSLKGAVLRLCYVLFLYYVCCAVVFVLFVLYRTGVSYVVQLSASRS